MWAWKRVENRERRDEREQSEEEGKRKKKQKGGNDGIKGRGGNDAIKEENKKKHRIFNIKGLTIRKTKLSIEYPEVQEHNTYPVAMTHVDAGFE